MLIAILPDKNGQYKQTKIPQYIQDILKRVKHKYDYTFILYPKYRHGQNKTFRKDIEQLEKWVKRYHADFNIIEDHNLYRSRTERQKGINVEYYIFEMTDPVLHQLEKAGYKF